MRLSILTILVAMLLAGCASTERFQRKMDSHLGWSIAELREHFGYNYIERDLGDGTRAYTWTWYDRELHQGYQSPDVIHTYKSADGSPHVIVTPGTNFPPSFTEYHCELSFIVGAQGRVIRWRAQGNGCAVYPGPDKVIKQSNVPPAPPTAQ